MRGKSIAVRHWPCYQPGAIWSSYPHDKVGSCLYRGVVLPAEGCIELRICES